MDFAVLSARIRWIVLECLSESSIKVLQCGNGKGEE